MPKIPAAATASKSLEEITEDFESNWNASVNLTDFLPAGEADNLNEVAGELIRLDMEYRWKAGERPLVEEYLAKVPQCQFTNQQLGELAFEEYRLRHRFDLPVSPEEFSNRLSIDASSWPRWESGQANDQSDSSLSITKLPSVGEHFHGYELVGILGQGVFGRVYLARQADLANRFVALKITEVSDSEPQALARLQHTNVVPIFSLQRDAGLQSICMPFLGLVTLRDLFRGCGDRSSIARTGKELISTVAGQKASTVAATTSSVSEESSEIESVLETTRHSGMRAIEGLNYEQTLLWMFSQITDGLSFAHSRGIVHGDMKPGNVLISDDGQPLILDFHLASGAQLPVGQANVGGTLPYMSGEHLQTLLDDGHPDESCDIFSIGVMLHEALTGKLPYPIRGSDSESIRKMIVDRSRKPVGVRRIASGISVDLESIVDKCLEPDLKRRYSSAGQVRLDIVRHAENRPLQFAPNRSPIERTKKWMRRHPRLSSASMMTFLGITITLVAASWIGSRIEAASRIVAIEQSRNFVDELKSGLTPLTVPKIDRARAIAAQDRMEKLIEDRLQESNSRDQEHRLRLANVPENIRNDELQAILYARFWLAQSRFETALNTPDSLERSKRIQAALDDLAPGSAGQTSPPRAFVQLQSDMYRQIGDKVRADQLASQLAGREQYTSSGLEDRLMEVAGFSRAGDYASAMNTLNSLVAANPADYRIWLIKGNSHLRLGVLEKAEECYGMCINLDQQAAWGYFQRGFVFLEQHKFAEAKVDFDHHIKLEPDDPTGFLNRALANWGLRNPEAAITDLTTAIARGCGEPRAWQLRYKYRMAIGQTELARADLQHFLELEPTDSTGWVLRGLGQMDVDKPEQALADFQSSLKLNLHSYDALQNIATVQSEYLNNTTAAIDALTQIIQTKPGDAVALVTRGVLYGRMGEREKAHADGISALKLKADADMLFRAAGIFALTSNDHKADAERAIGLLQKASFLDPQRVLSGILEDPDLKPLHENEQFASLVEQLKSLSGQTGLTGTPKQSTEEEPP